MLKGEAALPAYGTCAMGWLLEAAGVGAVFLGVHAVRQGLAGASAGL